MGTMASSPDHSRLVRPTWAWGGVEGVTHQPGLCEARARGPGHLPTYLDGRGGGVMSGRLHTCWGGVRVGSPTYLVGG